VVRVVKFPSLAGFLIGVVLLLVRQEAVLQDFIRRNSALRVHAKHLIKEIQKLVVAYPVVASEVEAFAEYLEQVVHASSN